MLISIGELRRFEVASRDGQVLGPLSDLLLDDRTWQTRYLSIDARSWLSRRVPLHPLSVRSCDPERRQIVMEVGRPQIEAAPPLDADEPISRQQAEQYYRHFAWPAYWSPSGHGFEGPALSRSAGGASDARLCHARSLDGLIVQARAVKAGRIADLLVDTSRWIVSYLVLQARVHWFPRRVLVAPRWTEKIGWDERRLHLDLDPEWLSRAPTWERHTSLSEYYKARLAGPDAWPPPH